MLPTPLQARRKLCMSINRGVMGGWVRSFAAPAYLRAVACTALGTVRDHGNNTRRQAMREERIRGGKGFLFIFLCFHRVWASWLVFCPGKKRKDIDLSIASRPGRHRRWTVTSLGSGGFTWCHAEGHKNTEDHQTCMRLVFHHLIPNLVPKPFNLSAALAAVVCGVASTTFVIFSSNNGPFIGFT